MKSACTLMLSMQPESILFVYIQNYGLGFFLPPGSSRMLQISSCVWLHVDIGELIMF